MLEINGVEMSRREAELILAEILPLVYEDSSQANFCYAGLFGSIGSTEAAPYVPALTFPHIINRLRLLKLAYLDEDGLKIYPDVAAVMRAVVRLAAGATGCAEVEVSRTIFKDWVASIVEKLPKGFDAIPNPEADAIMDQLIQK